MDGFAAILVIAVLFGVYYLWNKFTDAASAKVNRGLFMRGAAKRGDILTSQPMLFRTKGDRAEVLRWILSHLAPATDRPKAVPSLFLHGTTEEGALLEFGSFVYSELLVIELQVEQEGEYTSGVVLLTEWKEMDGVLAREKDLARIHETIASAVRAADPSATVQIPLENAA